MSSAGSLSHVISQGECLASIAHKYGFLNYRTIYDHADNTEFRRKRPNPNVVFPGDVVVIPARTVRDEQCQTDSRHTFRLGKFDVRLRLVLRDRNGQPYKSKRFELSAGGATLNGMTDSKGLVEAPVPANAESAHLTIWLSDEGDNSAPTELDVQLGHLDPIDEIQGIQGRLNNLGFFCGPCDGIAGPRTRQALRLFQEHFGLKATGEQDDETRAKLAGTHDSV
ncbi:MAG: peptidoglycan-binding protein [Bryobacteraceae bacterium]|nr:peptidoglycan-binding protein [Bryobacteraceae bacterium]